VLDYFEAPLERRGDWNDLIDVSLLYQRRIIVFKYYVEKRKYVLFRHRGGTVNRNSPLDLRIDHEWGDSEGCGDLVDELVQIRRIIGQLDLIAGKRRPVHNTRDGRR
jgi:hypothetical protein